MNEGLPKILLFRALSVFSKNSYSTSSELAIKNNKELKIKLLESALANRQLEKIKFEMLPSIATNAGYTGSENYTASSSATVTGDIAGGMGTSY